MKNILRIRSHVEITKQKPKLGDIITSNYEFRHLEKGNSPHGCYYRVTWVGENGEVKLILARDIHDPFASRSGKPFPWENISIYTQEQLAGNHIIYLEIADFVGPLPRELSPIEKKIRYLNGKYSTHHFIGEYQGCHV